MNPLAYRFNVKTGEKVEIFDSSKDGTEQKHTLLEFTRTLEDESKGTFDCLNTKKGLTTHPRLSQEANGEPIMSERKLKATCIACAVAGSANLPCTRALRNLRNLNFNTETTFAKSDFSQTSQKSPLAQKHANGKYQPPKC